MEDKSKERASYSDDDIFWNARSTRRETLSQAVYQVCAVLEKPHSTFIQAAATLGYEIDRGMVERQRKFGEDLVLGVAGESKKRGRARGSFNGQGQYLALVHTVLKIIDHQDVTAEPKLADTKEVLQTLLEERGRYMTAPPAAGPDGRDHERPEDNEKRRLLERNGSASIKFIAGELGVPVTDFSEVSRRFFSRADLAANTPETYFHCYRFHTRPGLVVKSFMAVQAPTAGFTACRFTHVFAEGDGQVRKTRGVMIPGYGSIYCLGAIEDYQAIKVLVLKWLGGRPRKFSGLALSMDGDRPIAARVFMKPTDFNHHEKAGVGVFPLNEVETELADDIHKLRNQVDFKLEDSEGIYYEGKPVSQSHMVELVDQKLRDASGRPLFTTADNRAFNPADDNFYTFNSVLRLWLGDSA